MIGTSQLLRDSSSKEDSYFKWAMLMRTALKHTHTPPRGLDAIYQE